MAIFSSENLNKTGTFPCGSVSKDELDEIKELYNKIQTNAKPVRVKSLEDLLVDDASEEINKVTSGDLRFYSTQPKIRRLFPRTQLNNQDVIRLNIRKFFELGDWSLLPLIRSIRLKVPSSLANLSKLLLNNTSSDLCGLAAAMTCNHSVASIITKAPLLKSATSTSNITFSMEYIGAFNFFAPTSSRAQSYPWYDQLDGKGVTFNFESQHPINDPLNSTQTLKDVKVVHVLPYINLLSFNNILNDVVVTYKDLVKLLTLALELVAKLEGQASGRKKTYYFRLKSFLKGRLDAAYYLYKSNIQIQPVEDNRDITCMLKSDIVFAINSAMIIATFLQDGMIIKVQKSRKTRGNIDVPSTFKFILKKNGLVDHIRGEIYKIIPANSTKLGFFHYLDYVKKKIFVEPQQYLAFCDFVHGAQKPIFKSIAEVKKITEDFSIDEVYGYSAADKYVAVLHLGEGLLKKDLFFNQQEFCEAALKTIPEMVWDEKFHEAHYQLIDRYLGIA